MGKRKPIIQKCAFCPDIATMTGEHVWSDWINKLFPNKKFAILERRGGSPFRIYSQQKLNVKLPVVCGDCNSGWMSRMERDIAIPAMADLILSDKLIAVTPEQQKSIAEFAFKCMVVADHGAIPRRPSFFQAAVRYNFASTLQLPDGLQLWLSAFKEDGDGLFRAV